MYMDKNEFIATFANQFDETDPSEIKAETEFRELEEWSSLIGLAIVGVINKKYGVKLSPDEFKNTRTVEEVYQFVQSKLS